MPLLRLLQFNLIEKTNNKNKITNKAKKFFLILGGCELTKCLYCICLNICDSCVLNYCYGVLFIFNNDLFRFDSIRLINTEIPFKNVLTGRSL